MTSKPVLEPAAQQFADATADPPFLFDLGPEKGREVVDQVPVSYTHLTLPTTPYV